MKHEDFIGMRKALGFCTESKTSEKSDKIMDSLSLESLIREAVLGCGLPQKQDKLAHHRDSLAPGGSEGYRKSFETVRLHILPPDPCCSAGRESASSCSLSHFSAARCAKRKYSSSTPGKPHNRNRWVKCTRGIGTDSRKRDGARERLRRWKHTHLFEPEHKRGLQETYNSRQTTALSELQDHPCYQDGSLEQTITVL